jgi:hypothetical protein
MRGSNQSPKGVAATILTDVHFWIPAVVLLGGLWVLYWIR